MVRGLTRAIYRLSPLSNGRVARRIEKAIWYGRFRSWCAEHACAVVRDRAELYQDVAKRERLSGAIDYLEFGCYRGSTMSLWLSINDDPDSRFYGFDTFTGLPEAWRPGFGAHHFSTDGRVPDLGDPRCRFVKGMFQDTLSPFLAETRLERRKVVHIDADLFSATLFVLLQLAPRLRSGDVLIFDEFQIWMDEFRAFSLFLRSYPLAHCVLARTPQWEQTAVKLTSDAADFGEAD